MEFFRLKEGRYQPCEEEESTHCMTTTNEYHGLKKALRLMKQHQSVAKGEYRLLTAQKRSYRLGNGNKKELWYMTVQTPYSVDMPAEAIQLALYDDFRENIFVEGRTDMYGRRTESTSFSDTREVTTANLIQYKENPSMLHDSQRLYFNRTVGEKAMMVGKFNAVKWNYSQGYIEVGFYATSFFDLPQKKDAKI